MDFTPNFTVCFVPSDSALSAAFDADPTLYAFAVDSQVLLAGPTNLLALLWSASLVLREQRRLENVDKILEVAQRFPDLIRNLVTPLHAMGKSLEQTVKAYNALVGSAESRLIPASRNLQRLGVSPGSKPMPELATLTTDPSLPTAEKWGSDPTDAEVAERSTILELDEFVDEEDVDNGDDLFSE
jgi:DNA recombination protein RmuC